MLTAAAFLAAFATACILAIFRHPIFGLSAYVALVYLHPPSTWWGQMIPSWRWSLLAAAVTLLGVIFHPSKLKEPRLFSFKLMWGLVFFVFWLGVQSIWALNPQAHTELFVLTFKYVLLVLLIYKCIDTVNHLKIFLWTHAAGCFYLGTVVIAKYVGGRFEGFRGPGIDESNAAALLIVTGVLTTFVLFLSGRFLVKAIAIGVMPITLNALVATISRSGFLALAVAGVIFNLFTPKKMLKTVRIFSVAGLVLLILITNPLYWERMTTIMFAGEKVEGVDTGSSRVVLIKAQFEMFKSFPMGCGHRCTAVLSPAYLDDRYLTGRGASRARSSHNTFMTLLVEQGVIGGILYILFLLWTAVTTFRVRKLVRHSEGLVPILYTAVIATLGAIIVGDLFVDYLKFEASMPTAKSTSGLSGCCS